jgi:N-acetylneuraminic acid mutarotase
MKTKFSEANQSEFFNLRVAVSLLVCGAVACSMMTGTLLAVFCPKTQANLSIRALTFAHRLAYQRAIEEVYWRHRIWPQERPDPKPSLDVVMSKSQLETKVEDYLRNSQALENYWQRPLTAEQLQGEMDRMAQNTKQPEVLRELFEALGNDPFVIAECLAKPVLSERLATNFYPYDQRFHAEPKQRAKAQHQVPTAMAAVTANYTLPVISTSSGGCTDDTWTPTNTTNAPDGRAFQTAVWTGSEMIVWAGANGVNSLNTGGRYNPVTDSWTATSTTSAPSARIYHTAAWTGSEMIVWGGEDANGNSLNTGGRYNPVTDSWTATSPTSAPSARNSHTAVWTGSEMIVWGGVNFPSVFNTGGRYDPSTDSWTATSTTNAPDARGYHTAVWIGSEMIVWGGFDANGNSLNTGGRYNPVTDSWTATSTTSAPSARNSHTAVWTGSEMIVWGGANVPSAFNTGGRYNPSTDSWTATSTTNAPEARSTHTAVWTATEMIVWGGWDANNFVLDTGGRYDPSTDSWTATSITNAPDARVFHTAVWANTTNQMIVWGGFGGYFNTGGRYCAQTGTPTPTPTPTATVTPTPTPTATATITPSPSPTATATSTPTAAPRSTPTPRPRPTPHPRPTP